MPVIFTVDEIVITVYAGNRRSLQQRTVNAAAYHVCNLLRIPYVLIRLLQTADLLLMVLVEWDEVRGRNGAGKVGALQHPDVLDHVVYGLRYPWRQVHVLPLFAAVEHIHDGPHVVLGLYSLLRFKKLLREQGDFLLCRVTSWRSILLVLLSL
ncbi:hypothetical protein D3C76_1104800 [compost metagenome]